MNEELNSPEDILMLNPQQILLFSFEELENLNPQVYELLSEKVQNGYFEEKLHKNKLIKLADQLIDCINPEGANNAGQ